MIEPVTLLTSVLTFYGIYAILAISLNVEYGFAGQPNFGKVFFFSIGGYVSGWLSVHVYATVVKAAEYPFTGRVAALRLIAASSNPSLSLTVFIACLLLSIVIGMLFGYLSSYPALKLRGDYLSILLLLVGEISRIYMRTNQDIVGGALGVGGIPNPFMWLKDPTLRETAYATLTLALTTLAYLYAKKLVNSPYGRLLKSIRDDEEASSVLGKKVSLIKAQSLVVGSSMAALAGVLYAFYTNYVNPDMFHTTWTLYVWLMVILGGIANELGPLIGALVFTLLTRTARFILVLLKLSALLPFEPNYIVDVSLGVLLIIILLYKPKGIVPEQFLKTPAVDVVRRRLTNGDKSHEH